jgi:hypothetical protein
MWNDPHGMRLWQQLNDARDPDARPSTEVTGKALSSEDRAFWQIVKKVFTVRSRKNQLKRTSPVRTKSG